MLSPDLRRRQTLKRRELNTIDIEAMIAGRPDTLITPDMSLNVLGSRLGPPQWWNFADERPFGALLGYGDFEIMVWSTRDRVDVRRIGLELWEGADGELQPKKKIRIARRVNVSLGDFIPGMGFDAAVNKIRSLNCKFDVTDHDDASEVKCVISLGKRCRLVFFRMNGELGLAEIQFLSLKGDS